MSARVAHRTFTATARRSLLKSGLSPSSSRVACRNKSTYQFTKVPSDKPWIIGSLLIFGSAFLYLVSPSARKKHHVEHKDKHDFPALMHDEHSKVKKDKTPEPELMKDDEGAVADVASSDVPNDAQPAEKQAEFKAAAEADSSNPPEQDPATTSPSAGEGEKPEVAEEGDKPPEPISEPEAAVDQVIPKGGGSKN